MQSALTRKNYKRTCQGQVSKSLSSTYNRLETAISSELAADVTAMLQKISRINKDAVEWTYNTTRRIATAPPLPMRTVAAAGAANPALVCEEDKGNGYVGNLGC